jgi:hypothetical protein
MAFSTFNSFHSTHNRLSALSNIPDVLWYKFEASDISSNNLNLKNYALNGDYNAVCTGSGMLSTATSAVGSGSLYLNGTNYVNLNSSAVNLFSTTQSGSYSIWFYCNSSTSGSYTLPGNFITPFLLQFAGVNHFNGFELSSSNNVITFPRSNMGDCYIPQTNQTISSNVWHNMTITIKYISTNLWSYKTYLDGILVPDSGGNSSNSFSGNSFSTQNSNSYIGYGFAGYVDDFRVYSYPLTQAQVTSIYNKI